MNMNKNTTSSVSFAGLEFTPCSRDDLFVKRNKMAHVITLNACMVLMANEEERFRDLINKSIVTVDGQITRVLVMIKNKFKKIYKVSGSDLVYDICKYASIENKKIFLLGGLEDSNCKSVELLKNQYSIDIDGYSPPYKPYPFDECHNSLILKKISEFKPDILLVGFGPKKQEYWIQDNYDVLSNYGIMMSVGLGGTFEFVSGKIPRAPRIIQNIGMESVFRFISEPKIFRFKRTFGNLRIFLMLFK